MPRRAWRGCRTRCGPTRWRALRPSLVLERMNGFAREVSGGPMATVLYGVIDPEEGRLRLATAGHPPVLVIGPGAMPTSPRARPAARWA